MVQIVIDNASNYVKAGKTLMAERKKLYWTPCAAHCLDLMLEDICKLRVFDSTIIKAKTNNPTFSICPTIGHDGATIFFSTLLMLLHHAFHITNFFFQNPSSQLMRCCWFKTRAKVRNCRHHTHIIRSTCCIEWNSTSIPPPPNNPTHIFFNTLSNVTCRTITCLSIGPLGLAG